LSSRKDWALQRSDAGAQIKKRRRNLPRAPLDEWSMQSIAAAHEWPLKCRHHWRFSLRRIGWHPAIRQEFYCGSCTNRIVKPPVRATIPIVAFAVQRAPCE
jgi:hypothetical protein